jgi:hypothetical protein
MQAELELQIAKVIREVDGANTMGASALAEHIATTLLEGKVLCEKEPVAWIAGEDLAKMQETETSCRVFSVEMGYVSGDVSLPLYAAADIGKEGGE